MSSRVTRRQARPCYTEGRGSSADEDERSSHSGDNRKRRRRMPARAARFPKKKFIEGSENSSSSKEEDEDFESETEEYSDEEQNARGGSHRSTHNGTSTRTRIQPSRAARQPSLIIDISSSAEDDADEGGEMKSLEKEATQRNPRQTRKGPSNRKRSTSTSSKTKKTQKKAPKVDEHTSKCGSTSDYEPASSNEAEEEEEDSDVCYDSEMKIQKIIASRSETRKRWQEICSKINTSEIENGSRWIQEKDDDITTMDQLEERFFIKWVGFSFLHCSWETRRDLTKFIEKSSTLIRNFLTKFPSGLCFNAEERGDGDYFDPSYVEIDRIVNVETSTEHCEIIVDQQHPDYDKGKGRQFRIKWVNLPYSDCTVEYERDLIINDIPYEDHLASFLKRSKKPYKNSRIRKDGAQRQLYVAMFGQKGDGDKASKLKEFQDAIYNEEYKNGSKLRDYQAEGITWMLSNYVENRSMVSKKKFIIWMK
jgi:hypothetical protein